MSFTVQNAKKTRKENEEVTEFSVCYFRVDCYENLKKHWIKHLAPDDDDDDKEEEQTKKNDESDDNMADRKS
jgi:hypothetical protein